MEPTCFLPVTGFDDVSNTASTCGYVTARASRLQLSRQTEDALAFGPTAKRLVQRIKCVRTHLIREIRTMGLMRRGLKPGARWRYWGRVPEWRLSFYRRYI